MSDQQRSEERERVEYLCRKCKACGGAGMMVVFHRQWSNGRFVTVTTERNGELTETKVPAEVSAHCFCELGQWMRNKTTEALKARIPDGAEMLEGSSDWLFQPPGSDPEERYEAPTRAAIARKFGKIPQAF